MSYTLGPYAKFPEPLKQKIMSEMWNYNNSNLAILETSHRSPVFAKVNDDTILAIRKYLGVPDNYKVLLMQGGEQLTQASIPFNLLKQNKKCTYLVTGPRSQFASSQAKIHPDVALQILNHEDFKNRQVEGSAYTYVCVQDWQTGFYVGEPTPLPNQITVLDCTSILGLHPISIKNHGIVFGAAEYSLGLPGVCITIVREDLVGKQMKECPNMMSYATMDEKKSIYNTPNCFAVYTLGEHVKFLLEQGGLQNTSRRAEELSMYVKSQVEKSNGRVSIDESNSLLIFNLKYDQDLQKLLGRLEEKKTMKASKDVLQLKIQSSTREQDIDLLFDEIKSE